MKRVVKPELLDALPSKDAGATGSRRDLRRLNGLMGHARILSGLLASALEERESIRIVELGAGDGWLMSQVARHSAGRWRRVELVLVDQNDIVDAQTHEEYSNLGWNIIITKADVFDWLKNNQQPVDAIVCNLFLHHFSEDQLVGLFRLAAAQAKVFVAMEPRRAMVPLAFSRFAGFIGCNAVTRHDIVVSVRAGFAGRELSALWPADPGWRLREQSAGLFSHVFLAEARTGDAAGE